VTVAALYVDPDGVYSTADDVECWGVEQDARAYPGPYPVVAHPPCKRWGKYWYGGPSANVRLRKGDDEGCFASALCSLRRWGGVLEHPEASAAWKWHGLNTPPRGGGWVRADPFGWRDAWTCCVEQGHYGHRARKATWLLACGAGDLPRLKWGPARGKIRIEDGYHSNLDRQLRKQKACARATAGERMATPGPFAEILLGMARSVRSAGRWCSE